MNFCFPLKRFIPFNDSFFCDGDYFCSSNFNTYFNSIEANIIDIKSPANRSDTCLLCKIKLPSKHYLDFHLLERHDSMLEIKMTSQPMFKCIILGCSLSFFDVIDRKDHLIKFHKYPSNFRYLQSLAQKKKSSALNNNSSAFMEIEIGNSSSQSTRSQSAKVPQSVCFGRGSKKVFKKKNLNGGADRMHCD